MAVADVSRQRRWVHVMRRGSQHCDVIALQKDHQRRTQRTPSWGLCGVALGLGALGVGKIFSEGLGMVLAAGPSSLVLGPSTATTVLQTTARCPFPAASVQINTQIPTFPAKPSIRDSLIPEIS
jgi:hypothetical protein